MEGAVVHQDRKAWAVLILSFGIAMTGLQDTFMKYLSGDYPFHQLQFIRSAMAVVLLFIAVALSGGFAGFDWRGIRLVLARGMVLGVGSAFFYVSLAAMTLADATAIYFAMPLIVAALSGFMIREKVRAWRWIAALVGLAGVLITIRPGSGLFEPQLRILLEVAVCLALFVRHWPVGRANVLAPPLPRRWCT